MHFWQRHVDQRRKSILLKKECARADGTIGDDAMAMHAVVKKTCVRIIDHLRLISNSNTRSGQILKACPNNVMLFEYIQLPTYFLEMKMKITHLLASVAILATTGSAFAAMDITGHFEDHTDFTSSRTRAEVRAELAQAQAKKLLVRSDADDVNASEIKRIESNTAARSLAGSNDSTGDQAPRPIGG
jgi:hypothetical protein